MRDEKAIPIIEYPSRFCAKYLREGRDRANKGLRRIESEVSRIVNDVARRGDRALFAYARKFDAAEVSTRNVRISAGEIERAARVAPAKIRRAIHQAAKRIRAFHERQLPRGFSQRTAEGTLAYRISPLQRVGVYIPGGHAPYPSSALMTIIPAQVAGVDEIAVAHPARGGLHPAVACALDYLGIEEVYRIGGAHAVAALAYGTQSIRPVDKIAGPGNPYVAMAKKLVFGVVDIDSVAGPSEVVILADASADPCWVALDLLAQAEHGSGDEVALAVTESRAQAEAIRACVFEEIARSPVKDVLRRLPGHAIAIIVAPGRSESIRFVNECAPEHLQIMTRTARRDARLIRNAGAIFVGSRTPVALGDYCIGANHVLPTGGTARFFSGLGVEDYMKRVSVAEVTALGLKRACSCVSALARAEGFIHHALSVERRVR